MFYHCFYHFDNKMS